MYLILSIPFLFAFIYYRCAAKIRTLGTTPKDENGEDVTINGLAIKVLNDEETIILGRLILVMSVCYYPAWPIIYINRKISVYLHTEK